MDAISYSYADKQAKRIKKFINEPDSTSGIVTVPKVIASGETITIPAGRVAILPNVQIDGVLNVENGGEVFIPTGTTTSKVIPRVTSTDNAIVRFDGTTGAVQDSSILIDDNGNLNLSGTGKRITGDFSNAIDSNRLSFETSTPNSYTVVNSFPNGTGVLSAFRAFNTAQGLNSSFTEVYCDQGQSMIRAGRTGAGTYQPMTFNVNGIERMRIDTAGDIGIGKISIGNKVAIKQRINSSTGGISIENVSGTMTAVLSVLDTGQLILRNNAIDTLAIVNGNTLHVSPNGGLGYGTGSGGTVTQPTSKSTAVTLNKPSGRITTHNQAMSAGSTVYFGVYNSVVGINDSVIITQNDSGTYTAVNYDIKVVYQADGLIGITIRNLSEYTLSDAIIFRFEVIKGAIA